MQQKHLGQRSTINDSVVGVGSLTSDAVLVWILGFVGMSARQSSRQTDRHQIIRTYSTVSVLGIGSSLKMQGR